MKVPQRRNYIIEIPLHWTPSQADAVFDFVCQLETAVFDAYEKEITQLAMPDICPVVNPDDNMGHTLSVDHEDDIPF